MAETINVFYGNDTYSGNIDNIVNNGVFLCYDSGDSIASSSSELPFSTFILCNFAPTKSQYFKLQIAINGVQSSTAIQVKMRRMRSSWTEWKSVYFV